jgi:hypothetical protein
MGYILSAVTARAHVAQGIRSVRPEAFPRYPSGVQGRTHYWVGEVAAEAEEPWRCCSTAIGETD